MRRLVVVGSLMVWCMSAAVLGQVVEQMTPALIEEAIAEGQKEKGRRPNAYRLAGQLGCDPIWVSTPYSRVVQAARRAKQQYKPFTAADVLPALIVRQARP